MAILSKEEAAAILKKVLSFSKADECEVSFNGTAGGNIRYARNSVSTSSEIDKLNLEISSAFGNQRGTATTNELDDDSLRKAVKMSEDLARLAPANPEHMAILGPQVYKETPTFSASTAAITPDIRAEAVSKSIQTAKAVNLNAAGFFENKTSFSALMNSKGLSAYSQETNVNFSLTVRNEAGTGSGYVARAYNDVSKLDTKTASEIAVNKALASVNARAIEPGKYTVILEPTASVVLLEYLFNSMDARSADEGRSFLSKAGGGTRLGQKLVDERVTFYSDPENPELPSAGWNGDGRPQEKVTWIDKGIVKNIPYSRYWAHKKEVKGYPAADRMSMMGGNSSLDEMIKSTEKGILVTKLWYIREVDPQTLLLTGLTRDGTFYIENGKIKFPVKNFRFNESPVIMLNNLDLLGKPERCYSTESANNYLIPPMRIRDFTFTSLSDAV